MLKKVAVEFNLLKYILFKLNIPYNKFYLRKVLLENPFSPSAKAISETLAHYNIQNLVVSVPVENILEERPFPFITLIKVDSFNKWIIIESSTQKYLKYYDVADKRSYNVDLKKIKNSWSGICLLYEASEESSEPFYGDCNLNSV